MKDEGKESGCSTSLAWGWERNSVLAPCVLRLQSNETCSRGHSGKAFSQLHQTALGLSYEVISEPVSFPSTEKTDSLDQLCPSPSSFIQLELWVADHPGSSMHPEWLNTAGWRRLMSWREARSRGKPALCNFDDYTIFFLSRITVILCLNRIWQRAH